MRGQWPEEWPVQPGLMVWRGMCQVQVLGVVGSGPGPTGPARPARPASTTEDRSYDLDPDLHAGPKQAATQSPTLMMAVLRSLTILTVRRHEALSSVSVSAW